MDDETFRTTLEPWMANNARFLLTTVESGSGVFRVIDIPGAKYQTGFISTSPGSFKEAGKSGNWYGTTVETGFVEVDPQENVFYEVTQFKQDTPFLTAHQLPDIFKEEIEGDKNLPDGRFSKSHIVLELAEKFLPRGSYSGVMFPSRRHPGGGVVTYDPASIPVQFTYTGIQPPPPELFKG